LALRFLAAAACFLLITEAAAFSRQPAARLEDRLRDYIARFEQEASALVAEEDYVQRVRRFEGTRSIEDVRRLRSDYVLVKPADNEPWLGYRDIFEVDGHAVRDREARVEKLLTSTQADSRARATAFVNEGSRFNLGPERTVNVPTLPLQLLARANAPRFRVRAPRNWQRQETAELTFEESIRPTIVRTPDGGSVESRGTVRVRVADGAVLEARLTFTFPKEQRNDGDATMEVRFAEVPGISVPVPVRMTEELPMPGAKASGIATYSNYRRFQTSVRIR
jgi:hypothetical protein